MISLSIPFFQLNDEVIFKQIRDLKIQLPSEPQKTSDWKSMTQKRPHKNYLNLRTRWQLKSWKRMLQICIKIEGIPLKS